jgi:hypothetical protein
VQLAAGGAERGLIAGLHGLAAAALWGWAIGWLRPVGAWPQQALWGALITVLAAGLGWWVARAVLPTAPRWLAWTGQAWQLTCGQASPLGLLALHAQIDLGHWLLMRYEAPQGATGWLVASVRADPSGWHLLRVALPGGPQPMSRGRPCR